MVKINSFIKKYKNEVLYGISLFFLFILVVVIFNSPNIKRLLVDMEAKTFDLRQIATADSRKVSKDIVIAAIDDDSYEYLIDKYGEWPIPREVYASFIDYLEPQKPCSIAFDLLFVKSLKSRPYSDAKLIDAIARNKNVFVGMNFDNRPFDLRLPVILPDDIKTNIKIDSKSMDFMLFPNCRSILTGIINATPNIGHINTPRSQDAISRTAPLFVAYPHYSAEALERGDTSYLKVDYYTYLALKVAIKYLNDKQNTNTNQLVIDKNNNLIIGSRKIPMLNTGEAILNWYGETGQKSHKTFTYVPFWKIIESIELEKQNKPGLLPKDYFKNKIVYVGTSVVSLSDIKTVPTEKYMPGVELHTTLLNNIIDNNVIKKVDTKINLLITAVFVSIIALIVFLISSTVIASASSVFAVIAYFFISTYIMQFFNLWIWTVIPVIGAVMTFIAIYLMKYIIKSRDLEYTYKLATTDGLTELYNHRYFQEQMLYNIDYSKRYESNFSLILIDIDFFKKFNDKFGHQAGDAVLKQVAQTLKKCVRSSDLVCRYGGEEMAIILRDTNKEEARIAAQKICDTVAQKPYKLGPDLESSVTISLGVATFPVDGETPASLIEHADKGLYAAKENGRNQVGKVD